MNIENHFGLPKKGFRLRTQTLRFLSHSLYFLQTVLLVLVYNKPLLNNNWDMLYARLCKQAHIPSTSNIFRVNYKGAGKF